jgi:ribonuclease HI
MRRNLEEFKQYREEMNKAILASDNLEIKRFFALDSAVYQDGAIPARTKELLGLVASTVLRCNDCILYHIDQCLRTGITNAEFHEAMSVALIVGGSITMPHLRYAFEMWNKAAKNGFKE